MGSRGPIGGPGQQRLSGPSGTEETDKKTLQRTEFIVLFCWREPTPSDKLLWGDEPTEGGDAAGTGEAGGSPTPGGR
jgi:hypothetical protein